MGIILLVISGVALYSVWIRATRFSCTYNYCEALVKKRYLGDHNFLRVETAESVSDTRMFFECPYCGKGEICVWPKGNKTLTSKYLTDEEVLKGPYVEIDHNPQRIEEKEVLSKFISNMELFKSLGANYDLGGFVSGLIEDPNPNSKTSFSFTVYDILIIEVKYYGYNSLFVKASLISEKDSNTIEVRSSGEWKAAANDSIKKLYYEALDAIDKFNAENEEQELNEDIIETRKRRYFDKRFDKEFNRDLQTHKNNEL